MSISNNRTRMSAVGSRKASSTLIGVLLASTLLAGCANNGSSATPGVDSQIQADISAQIAQSAERAANARETLAMIQKVRTPPVSNAVDETNLPPELKRPVKTISWAGPARELVREMAANIGYSFQVQGSTVANEPSVNVEIHDVSAAQAFANVGIQVIPYATVIVNPNLRSVIFRYENHPGAAPAERAPYRGRPARIHHAPLVK